MRYRPEIDGLRAIAVIPVILFHAGFEAFSGGFVGVDVFFVISGYLITSLLLEEMEEGRFTLLGFYERRARRILPALFLVCLVSLPFAWVLLFPGDMRNYAESLAAVSLFSTNILFWQESGYFESAAELKPLLHTWSLAVEEQFYIFFPLLLLAAGKLGRARLLWVLVLLFAISFGVASWASRHAPAAGFYLLPARGWEILLGAFLAFVPTSGAELRLPSALREGLALLGLLLICSAVFFFERSTPTPSVYTLVPTMGAVLLIAFARSDGLVGQLLSSRPLVSIGLMSYSAYLWHQPVFAFARYGKVEEEALWETGILCGLTAFLAFLSWRFVEKPFRRRGPMRRLPILLPGVTVASLFAVFFVTAQASGGFAFRSTSTELEIQSFQDYPFGPLYRKGTCFLWDGQQGKEFADACSASEQGRPLIWGDSFGAALSVGFRDSWGDFTQLTASACPPLVGEEIHEPFEREHCLKINEIVSAKLAELRPNKVLLHAIWHFYPEKLGALARTVERIRAASPDSEIWVVGAPPFWDPNLLTLFLDRGLRLNKEGQYLTVANYERAAETNAALEAMAKALGVRYLDPLDRLCRGRECLATGSFRGVVEFTAWDYGHLTRAGAALLAEWIEEQMVDAAE